MKDADTSQQSCSQTNYTAQSVRLGALSSNERLQSVHRSMAPHLDEWHRSLNEFVRVDKMWERWVRSGSPWRGQMSRARRAIRRTEQLRATAEDSRFESGISDYGTFFGHTVHVPTLRRDLLRREKWQREWYDYGRSLVKGYRHGKIVPLKVADL